ncbi:hypothetical protein CPB84DRAFT_1815310 [Gymnopilus junonius]|uniref:Uncharacterized protein n=1 Tax=Gymnopilus junonius TaxID=109634 RepID=A0A9P5TNY3_GYMJU|nr:hypothetical protein CPB84DRAFT_1815310 [Gymnopilus junonius]
MELDDISQQNAHAVDANFVPEVDDIKIEFHPKSSPRNKPQNDEVPNDEPWEPFHSRLDFEIAELMLESHLNAEQSTALLSLFRKVIKHPDDFTLSNTHDLERIWTDARRTRGTGFKHKSIAVKYKDKDIIFPLSTRPIWNWIEELVDEPNVVPLFWWDAECHYRWDGLGWEQFIDEPWTADDWWNLQTKLPDGASPVFLLIYADKSQLSSFGTAKGYPVFARCANLPSDIRNGNGFAGGWLVGWLPVGYVNFKRIVWHRSLYEILDSIWLYGKTGFQKECGDNISRWLFPIILILSADYEEQCVMALIHGLQSYAPCPVCLIPGDELSNLSQAFELRTVEKMKQIYQEAQKMNAASKEELLKKYGLRDVENTFWDMHLCDPYQALSWDGLHAHESGLFGDHILPELKRVIGLLGKEAAKQLDKQTMYLRIDLTPRWKGLNHFSEVMKIEFTDGGKYADIAKAHSHKHVFTDIMRKGVARNFSTKPNEKAHGPLKSFYQLMTNFKDFGIQVNVVSTLIREQIDLLDRLGSEQQEDEDRLGQSQLNGTEHISLFSAVKPCTIEYLESQFSHDDSAFRDFRKHLSRTLSSMLNVHVNLTVYDESTVSWGKMTDIVRAHPSFHNHPRYDCVIVNAGDDEYFFARLLYIFGIFVQGETQYMALILPYDAPIPHTDRPRYDKDLKFTRVRARHQSQASFIHVESIVRGAVLIPAHDALRQRHGYSAARLNEQWRWLEEMEATSVSFLCTREVAGQRRDKWASCSLLLAREVEQWQRRLSTQLL